MKWKLRILSRKYYVIAIILLIPAVYISHISLIHLGNARHMRAWELLRYHAMANGIKTRPTADSLDLIHFYDKSKPFKHRTGWIGELQGFKNSRDEIVFPSEYSYLDKYFSEGMAFANHIDGTRGYILPDQSFAFEINYRYAEPFVNGMAHVRNELSSNLITPQIRSGFIDMSGNLIIPVEYEQAKDFVGSYTLVVERTIYAPISDRLMNGIDINIGPVDLLFPHRKLFLDTQGSRVSPSKVLRSIEP